MNGFLNYIKHTSNALEDLQKYSKDNYVGEINFLEQQVVKDNKIIAANGTAFWGICPGNTNIIECRFYGQPE